MSLQTAQQKNLDKELRLEIARLKSCLRDLQWDKFAIKALVMRGNEWSDEALFQQLKADFKARNHVITG